MSSSAWAAAARSSSGSPSVPVGRSVGAHEHPRAEVRPAHDRDERAAPEVARELGELPLRREPTPVPADAAHGS